MVGEDGEGIAADVGLWAGKSGQQSGIGICVPAKALTVMRRESQTPVARACNRGSGLPGRTALILPVRAGVGRHVAQESTRRGERAAWNSRREDVVSERA